MVCILKLKVNFVNCFYIKNKLVVQVLGKILLEKFRFYRVCIGASCSFLLMLLFSSGFVVASNISQNTKIPCDSNNDVMAQGDTGKHDGSDFTNYERSIKDNYIQKHCFAFTELSQNTIFVGDDFKGRKITIFGNKSCPNGKVIFIVKGKDKSFQIVKKEKKAGMWLSGDTMRFSYVPSLYLLSTKHRLNSIIDLHFARRFAIGLDNIQIVPDIDVDERQRNLEDVRDARESIISHQIYRGLFVQNQMDSKNLMETNSLFKGTFFLPRNVNPNTYTVQTIVTLNGKPNTATIEPLFILQNGFGVNVRYMAINNKFVYYLCCIFLAVGMGLFAFVVVEIIGNSRMRRRKMF